MWVKSGAHPRVEQIKGVSFVSALTLPAIANISLGWKGLQGANTQAYYENSLIADKKVVYHWA